MQEPSFLFFTILILSCLILAVAGLYVLANFSSLFRSSIRNELLRKNVVVWLAIFFISASMAPLGSGFFYILYLKGWWAFISIQLLATTADTIFVYNIARFVAGHRRIKNLPFFRHKLLVTAVIILMTLVVNIPVNYVLFNYNLEYLKYSVISCVYLGGVTGLIYSVISYLDIERQRKIDEKELELSRLRELKSKAELDALHSKVNPHFLYNALNSIADLSITDGKKARQMTIALADLFRYSINYSNNNYSTVKDEVEMANVYLQIEKIRFEDKLNYTLKVEDGLNHFLVPRFVLQPLVENAVKHGLKATGQMTEINLEVKKNGTGLVINISDTGPLFPDELTPGYGVKSVYDKLDLLFPGNYEMHFSNKPRKQVSLYINKLMKDESAV